MSDRELAGALQDGVIEVEFDHDVYNELHRHRDPVLAEVALTYQDFGLQGLRAYFERVFGRRVLVVSDGKGPHRLEWGTFDKPRRNLNQSPLFPPSHRVKPFPPHFGPTPE